MTQLFQGAFTKAIAVQFKNCEDFKSADTELHVASYEGNTALVKEILSRSPSREIINKRNHLGCTALRLAATGGHVECVDLLLHNGASIDISDVKAQSPLYVAVKNSHYHCAKLLLQWGADPNGDAYNRSSPLCIASMNGSLEFVELLLQFHADVVLQRKSFTGISFTVDPLQLAITYLHYDCLKALLLAGRRLLQAQFSSPFTGVTSYYHMMVKHKCGGKFFDLLFEFGFSPFVTDGRGHFPWDAIPFRVEEGEEKGDIIEFFQRVKNKPRTLRSACRLSVWRHLMSVGKTVIALHNLWSVPDALRRYLMFETLN